MSNQYEITYKLVGVKGNLVYHKKYDKDTINLKDMHDNFVEIGVKSLIDNLIKESSDLDESIIDNPMSAIMYITERESVNDVDKNYKILNENNENKRIIHIFSKISKVREILKECFSKFEYNKNKVIPSAPAVTAATAVPVSPELNQEVVEKEPDIQSEVIIESNDEISKLLQDPDFLKLIQIYKSKSHLLSTLLNFVSVGDIINKVNFDEIKFDDFSDYEEAFSKLHHILQNYKLNMEEDNLKKLLFHFKGNYNLVFRYLLVENNLQLSESK